MRRLNDQSIIRRMKTCINVVFFAADESIRYSIDIYATHEMGHALTYRADLAFPFQRSRPININPERVW
jgi:hypothetical protein